jgi:receptor protein-tyrosine kinase
MKNPQAANEPLTPPFVERRAAVRELPGRALATRDAHRIDPREPAHYPLAPYSVARKTVHPDLVALAQPFSDRAEEFRSLRSELLGTAFTPARARALAVLSQDAGDGKSYTAANLAVSLSQLGGDTLLVDSNLHVPMLHVLLGIPMQPGLSEVLGGQAHEDDAIVAVAGVPGLHFLSAGLSCGEALRLLQGPRMRALVQQVLARFDHVILDTPANAGCPDARVVAAQAGGALIVARGGHSRVATLQKLLDQLDNGPAVLAGVVLNRH